MSKYQRSPKATIEAQAEELAAIDAQIKASDAKVREIYQEREILHKRREFVATRLERQRLQESVGGYVKLTKDNFALEPKTILKPTVGAIGRVVRIGRTRALIDFGEDLHTWYVPLIALGTVRDPLAEGIKDDSIIKVLDGMRQKLHEDIIEYDELTDEERWEDEQS